MPVLMRRLLDRLSSGADAPSQEDFDQPVLGPALGVPNASGMPASPGGILSTCGNPACASGWLKLFRSRSAPVFEGGWCCTPACARQMIEAAIRREMDSRAAGRMQPYRIPLGLAMLEQGWISAEQLRRAIEAQRSAGRGRIGYWLAHSEGVSEQLVTRALALQRSCPVLNIEFHNPDDVAALVPRLFVDAFGALPMRPASSRMLYLGFEDRLDPVLALGVERISGFRVECGLVAGSRFEPAHAAMLKARYPETELIEASSEATLAQALGKSIERVRPVDSRLVRVHDCLWLRMWLAPRTGPAPAADQVRDVIAYSGAH